jgi:hypothetical protein
MNRTGIGTSPIDSADIVKTAREALAGAACADGHGAAEVRRQYENEAEPVGTVPIPTTLKGAVKTAVDMLRGRAAAPFVDKLGERLAFERTGTRLYEALLTKHDTAPAWPGGPARADLQRLHDEELAHFELLRGAMRELGVDPTAETPAADIIGVASSGMLQVVTDPRTTLPQSLGAILAAELVDNDGWQMLVDAARVAGKDDLVPRFQRAQQEEAIHLGMVRGWLSAHLQNAGEEMVEEKPLGSEAADDG